MEGHDSRGLDGDEGEAPPPGSLNFHEYLTSEESKEVEKKPLMAQSSPPDIRHGRAAETKPKASYGKNGPSSRFRYNTHLPFDRSRFKELETLLEKELSESTETKYDISFKRSKRDTVLIEFTMRRQSEMARDQIKEALDKAVKSALGTMSPGKVIVTYPAKLKEYTLDNVPFGSKLAGRVASIAEGILRDVFGKCKVTYYYDDKGCVFYKVSKSGIKSHFKGIGVPLSLKPDIFMHLKVRIDKLQKIGWDHDFIASHSSVMLDEPVRRALSDKYGLNLVKEQHPKVT
jgi:hypothetical protein